MDYLKFSDEVKALAREKYGFTFNPHEPISIFVAAFYDAVLLYAHALRDYIEVCLVVDSRAKWGES